MSSRYGSSDRRSSSSRRSSPPRRRSSPGPSRRSPPPKPRDPKTLPEQFGRSSGTERPDDESSVLQRMKGHYKDSPLEILYHYVEKAIKVKIWTRNYKEVRGVMTGYIIAFDKHWNIILSGVDEVYLKPKKSKAPFLRDVAANESLPDIPAKVPKKKPEERQPPPAPKPKVEGSEKKKRRHKKSRNTSEKRETEYIFIRGDNVVIICPNDQKDAEEETDSS